MFFRRISLFTIRSEYLILKKRGGREKLNMISVIYKYADVKIQELIETLLEKKEKYIKKKL